MTQIHPQARTTPKVRAEIQKATGTLVEIAQQFNISVATARKWRTRQTVQDRSHRPHMLSRGSLRAKRRSCWSCAAPCCCRWMTCWWSRASSSTPRPRVRRWIAACAAMACRTCANYASQPIRLEAGQASPKKSFKDYEPGFVHIDIKYLPQMPDETARRYLFVAIDRATRWVFVRIYADQSEASSCDFLWRLHQGRADGDQQGVDGQRQPVHRPLHGQGQDALGPTRV